jgi:general secretion pathway protein I
MRVRGFTLIEVMVALFVIALGVGALLTTLVSAADNVAYLRDRSFAQWIAFNRLAEIRLSSTRPAAGTKSDAVEYAGTNWRLVQTISEAGIGDLLRVDVQVVRLRAGEAAEPAGQTEESEVPQSSLGRAIGFIGPSLARASGISPDWNPRATGPGPGGGGDEGGDDRGRDGGGDDTGREGDDAGRGGDGAAQ